MSLRTLRAVLDRLPRAGAAGGVLPVRLAALLPARSAAASWLPALAATALALVLALFVWDGRRERLQKDLFADFSFESREIALRLNDRMGVYRQVLRGTRSAMSASSGLSPQQWESYVGQLHLSVDFPGVRAIGYARAIELGRLDQHEDAVRQLGLPGYRVWPVDDRGAAHVAISRLAPATPANEALVGRELSREPALRRALEASAERARAALSETLPLAASVAAEPSPHVLLLVPIYDSQRLAGTASPAGPSRRQATTGWVFALFDTGALVAETVGPLPPTMRLQVYDTGPGAQGALLFDSARLRAPAWGAAEPLRVRAPLEIDGRTWTLLFEGFPRAYTGRSPVDADAVAIGLICLLFAASVALATRTRLDATRLQTLSTQLKASNDRFQHLASHDALTGVANRARFQERLQAMLDRPANGGAGFALVYVDLDGFKPVNDTHGHRAGDELLVAVTRRLQGVLRDEDLLARRGGDEFVVLVHTVATRADAEEVAERMRCVLAEPFRIDGHSVRISGSLGIAVHPEDGREAEALVHQADRCMYLAKERGRNRWVSRDDAAQPA